MPSEKVIKRLFALSGNKCAFPECQIPIFERNIVTGEICHIRAKNPKGKRYDCQQTDEERNSFENLILLCRHHHKMIDSDPELYATDKLIKMKRIHESIVGRPEKPDDIFSAKRLLNDLNRVDIRENSGNIAINNSGDVIQGNNITIKSSKKTEKINPPRGTIGFDGNLTRYIQHLITRYNQYAKSEPSKKNFHHGAISRNIETRYGAKWNLLDINKADEVIEYLQGRIKKTRIAKFNTREGNKSFSTLEEYINKYNKKNKNI